MMQGRSLLAVVLLVYFENWLALSQPMPSDETGMITYQAVLDGDGIDRVEEHPGYQSDDDEMDRETREPRLRFAKKEARLRFTKREPRLRYNKREPRLRFTKREPRLRFTKREDYEGGMERDVRRDPRLRFAKREDYESSTMERVLRAPRLRFVKREATHLHPDNELDVSSESNNAGHARKRRSLDTLLDFNEVNTPSKRFRLSVNQAMQHIADRAIANRARHEARERQRQIDRLIQRLKEVGKRTATEIDESPSAIDKFLETLIN